MHTSNSRNLYCVYRRVKWGKLPNMTIILSECSISDRQGAETYLAFQSLSTVHIQLYTCNRLSNIFLASWILLSPTGCVPREITIPGADIHSVFSIDQTRLVVICQGPEAPCCQTHDLSLLIPAGQRSTTPEVGVLTSLF